MPYLPELMAGRTARDVTDAFYGYNHQLKIGPGEFFDTQNLTTKSFPMLASRHRRGLVKTLSVPQGLLAKEHLAYIDDGVLFYDGKPTPVTLTPGHKQMVSMGAYICIFPDKVYYNTASNEDSPDYGEMDYSLPIEAEASYELCSVTGVEYENYSHESSQPVDPQNGALWFDHSANALKIYSSSQGEWVSVETVYTKITFSNLDVDLSTVFKVYDGVTIGGTAFPDELNGDKVIYGVGPDYIIVIGLIDVRGFANLEKVEAYPRSGQTELSSTWLSTSDGGDALTPDQTKYYVLMADSTNYEAGAQFIWNGEAFAEREMPEPITIERTVPQMDFVIECQNRLWGCFYGKDEAGNTLNEIYCSALGDFKNWRQYMGLSTDSWTASVGSDGPWTGAINYLGYPTFFKENTIHRVTVSAIGAHSLIEQACRGVQNGSGQSLAIVNETLLYKTKTDVVVYQGGFPDSVSDPLGDVVYSEAVGGTYGSLYYISMKDETGIWHLFVFDVSRRVWVREDNLHALDLASVGDHMYALAEDGKLWDLTGRLGEEEESLPWFAQTGVLYYEYPDRKYVSRYDIRLSAKKGTTLDIYIQYDSNGIWQHCGHYRFKGINTVTFPVRPRRCDHLELKIVGENEVKIYSIARILEQGSDV